MRVIIMIIIPQRGGCSISSSGDSRGRANTNRQGMARQAKRRADALPNISPLENRAQVAVGMQACRLPLQRLISWSAVRGEPSTPYKAKRSVQWAWEVIGGLSGAPLAVLPLGRAANMQFPVSHCQPSPAHTRPGTPGTGAGQSPSPQGFCGSPPGTGTAPAQARWPSSLRALARLARPPEIGSPLRFPFHLWPRALPHLHSRRLITLFLGACLCSILPSSSSLAASAPLRKASAVRLPRHNAVLPSLTGWHRLTTCPIPFFSSRSARSTPHGIPHTDTPHRSNDAPFTLSSSFGPSRHVGRRWRLFKFSRRWRSEPV